MILLDATSLIALGELGGLDVVTYFDGRLAVPPAVVAEITAEPERSNVTALLESDRATALSAPPADAVERARELLDERTENGDVHVIAFVLDAGDGVAVVSDDRRVRTTAAGLGAEVTGTLGAVVRAVAAGGVRRDDARELVRRLDENGLHTTAELRERVFARIDEESNG